MFQGYEKSTGNIIISSNKEKKTAPADILIGADGPLSKVSRYFFQYRPKFFSTIQFIIRNEKASNEYKVQFHREFKDFFIWQVPRNQFLMIGTATMQHINLKQKFLEYLKREKVIQSDHDVVKIESGLIPMFDYKRKIHITLEDSPDRLHHVFLVGDAAGQVKASTGGGIVSGLKFANLLSESITSRHYSQYRFKLTNCYNLILHKKVRGAFNSFSETDYQALMAILNRPHMKKILCETTRDEPWKLLLRFFINNPAFILSRARLFRSIL